MAPPYYGTADTLADEPCNPVMASNLNENWSVGDFVGLDNDGDNDYDGADEDCATGEANCFDGLDNDNDGAVDCEDTDCNGAVGPETTCGEGECAGNTGNRVCRGGLEEDTCEPQGGAESELCDGLDNDCDGETDEVFPVGAACTVGVGECAATGLLVCTTDGLGTECDAVEGEPEPEGPPGGATCGDGLDNDCDGLIDINDPDCQQAEICDGIDNDGDGQIDEDLTQATTCGVGACSGNTGTETCEAGQWVGDTCDPLAGASAEVCDNVDNDCDGSTDEDLTQATTCGVGACSGNTGTETCSAGQWVGDTCDPLAGASAELCDNLDNDCDGSTDEDLTRDTTCGVGECSATGTETCDAGQWGGDTCTPGTPSAEVCDNLDNDCDGSTDEDLTRDTTCGVGECAGNAGVETCTAGVWGDDTCDPFAGAVAEVCDDTLDNDCDGATDIADDDCAPIDLDIAQFQVTKRVRLSGKKAPEVAIKLVVKNNGDLNHQSRWATITGMKGDSEVYYEELQVSDPVGNGRTTFTRDHVAQFPAGDIVWTAKIMDDDPDEDLATAITTVVP
jgi:hypothetical protein